MNHGEMWQNHPYWKITVHIFTQTIMNYLHKYYQLFISVSKFSHVIWLFLILFWHSYFLLVHPDLHNVKEPRTKTCQQKHVSTEDTKHSISLLSHPQTQKLYHIETLYLPGYITHGAVLRIIKETHIIKLTVHKYFFWNWMLQGSTMSNWIKVYWQDQMKGTFKLFTNMALLTANRMYWNIFSLLQHKGAM